MDSWNTSVPADTELAGDGDDQIRDLKDGLKDILDNDHQMGQSLEPLQGNCDGYHRKLTLYPLDSDPSIVTGAGIFYSKVIDNVIELFWMDDDGLVNQLTENGVLKLNTLANNIDADGHSILNVGIEGNIDNALLTVHDFDDEILYDSGLLSVSDGEILDKSTIYNVKRPCLVKLYVKARNNGSSTTADYTEAFQEIATALGLGTYIILGTKYYSVVDPHGDSRAHVKKFGGSSTYEEDTTAYCLLMLPGTYSVVRSIKAVGGSGNYQFVTYVGKAWGYNGETLSDVIEAV
jgi:hypothetical protein